MNGGLFDHIRSVFAFELKRLHFYAFPAVALGAANAVSSLSVHDARSPEDSRSR